MEEKTFNIKIHGIELLERNLYRANISETDDFNFGINCQAAVDEIRKILIVLIEVEIKNIDESLVFAKFTGAFGFKVEEFEQSFERISDKRIKVYPQLDKLLQSVTVSTMRGIIFSDLRGTPLHKAIMPLINIDAMHQSDVNLLEKLKE